MMVNVTMLTRNRPRLTKQALTTLCKNWSNGMRLTILDDRSEQETLDILRYFYGGLCAVVRNTKPIGTGEARNMVVKASERVWGRGGLLYLSDNDVAFRHGWLEKLTEAYEAAWTKGFRVLGAYNHPFHLPTNTLAIAGVHVHSVNALATQSMLMRWEVWDKYGPFCQTPVDKVCQSEDVDFTNRIRADGFKIGVVSPALVVSTGITNTFGQPIPGWELVKRQAPDGVIVE